VRGDGAVTGKILADEAELVAGAPDVGAADAVEALAEVCATSAQVPPTPVFRSMRRPVSLPAFSRHDKLMAFAESAVPDKALGAAGRPATTNTALVAALSLRPLLVA
jgi:hypothetical protein